MDEHTQKDKIESIISVYVDFDENKQQHYIRMCDQNAFYQLWGDKIEITLNKKLPSPLNIDNKVAIWQDG